MTEDERKYLLETIEETIIDKDFFAIKVGQDREILGVTSNNDSDMTRLFQYKTLYDSIADVSSKTQYSLITSISILDDENLDDWNPFHPVSNNEKNAVYFLENAVFRIEILWDLLAQIVNLRENIGVDVNRIYAKSFFNNLVQGDSNNFFAKCVLDYMSQADNTNVEKRWEGNYLWLKDYRNQMTHRNSPNISSMSNYDMNIRQHPMFLLKRIIEDFSQAKFFIKQYFESIILEYSQKDIIDF